MKTYLLAGAMLIAVIAPAEAADPRVIIRAAPKVIHTAPIEAVPETVVVEVGIPMKIVDQGPRYDGPNLVAFPKPIFQEDQPVRAYPYVRTYEAAHAYVPEAVEPRVPRIARYRAPIRALN